MVMEDLPKEFTHKMAPGNIIRANLRTEKDAAKWINLFSSRTSTNWIVYKSKTPPKFLLDRKWICGHNRKSKTRSGTKSADCSASIDIKIKRLNKGAKSSDQYLTYNPPLTAVISLNLQHEHDTPVPVTSSGPVSSRAQQQNEEMKELFYEYFSKGMDTARALNHHIKLSLSDNQCDADDVDLGDVTFQPKKIMYTWYEEWKSSKKVNKEEKMLISTDDEEDISEGEVDNLSRKMENDEEDKPEFVDVKPEIEDSADISEVKESTLQELHKIFALLGDNCNHLKTVQSINSKIKKITTNEESVDFLNVLDSALSSVD